MRALLSKAAPQYHAKQDHLERGVQLSRPPGSLHFRSHPFPSLDQDQPQHVSLNRQGAASSSNTEATGAITPAVLQVQRRCAAAHHALSSAAKDLVQASLHLPDRPQQHQQRRQRDASTQHLVSGWSLAVKPFAEAQPAVALHALSAVMQVGCFA